MQVEQVCKVYANAIIGPVACFQFYGIISVLAHKPLDFSLIISLNTVLKMKILHPKVCIFKGF